MEGYCLGIVLLLGWFVSNRVQRRTVRQRDALLERLNEKAARMRRVESELDERFRMVSSRFSPHPTRHRIDLRNFILVDRSLMYTKRAVQTYYNLVTGEVAAIYGQESMLVVSKREIDRSDLERLLESKSGTGSAKKERLADPEEYVNLKFPISA